MANRRDLDVDQHSKDVDNMVWAAKYGEWNTVEDILKNKPYLINCIPQHRKWAVVHQAAWWGNECAIKNMLQCPSFDSEVNTRGGEFWPKCTKAAGIAEKKGFTKVAKILRNFRDNERQDRFSGTMPTFVTAPIKDYAIPLFLLSVASYKQALHPDDIGVKKAFKDVMEEVYKYTWEREHWEEAKKVICSSLLSYCKAASDYLQHHSSNEDKFHSSIIKLYTKGYIYREVNDALRKEGQLQRKFKATGDDVAVGPYALMLDILLFFWKDLTKETRKTYRGMDLQDDDLKKYQVGTQFVWLSFVSSSTNREKANEFGNVLFVISNDTPEAKLWCPRNIHCHSMFPGEMEAIYPAGAEFKVTKVTKHKEITKEKYEIELKLMSPTN